MENGHNLYRKAQYRQVIWTRSGRSPLTLFRQSLLSSPAIVQPFASLSFASSVALCIWHLHANENERTVIVVGSMWKHGCGSMASSQAEAKGTKAGLAGSRGSGGKSVRLTCRARACIG